MCSAYWADSSRVNESYNTLGPMALGQISSKDGVFHQKDS